ncbi:Fe-S cluster biogenesis protein NfuA, 4Fe-4S-binding domain [Enhydrobacter aerosaccus]|uniref:Fe-S cluster biogenesis protein NfuA, 4Fe-4S-binding domain n=1 Tax=Enhydrobacter aerosaccus TaxID=225324 RepID=A0A1T4R4D6_9HYPH|nr:NifU family protein [Enhydrobacter aerosaccus]SKA10737.1 Fe-S cluster biogenesis protein NfuA, 4Fe-4S-binding domain [Enhydrobacter aerosaccus]
MFIQTEQTPNPSTLKFIPGRVVMEKGTVDFANVDTAQSSPLAKRLFAVDGVERVFFGTDFVTVTKAADKDWQMLKPSILGGIMEHYTSGEPVVAGEAGPGAEGAAGEDDEVVAQIKDILETRVRPAVAQDGGDIVFQDFRDGVVYLHMQGSCSGCPSSTATLKMGIENLLKHYVPEVVEVQAAQ